MTQARRCTYDGITSAAMRLDILDGHAEYGPGGRALVCASPTQDDLVCTTASIIIGY